MSYPLQGTDWDEQELESWTTAEGAGPIGCCLWRGFARAEVGEQRSTLGLEGHRHHGDLPGLECPPLRAPGALWRRDRIARLSLHPLSFIWLQLRPIFSPPLLLSSGPSPSYLRSSPHLRSALHSLSSTLPTTPVQGPGEGQLLCGL